MSSSFQHDAFQGDAFQQGAVGASAAISGTLAVTLDDASLSAAGTLAIVGVASITLDDAVSAATGALDITGVEASTLDDATLVATGVLSIAGVLAVTLDDVTLSAVAAVQQPLDDFDTHDGSPKTNWDARQNREKRERELIREAIQAAMLETFPESRGSERGSAPTLPPQPLSPERRHRLVETLLAQDAVPSVKGSAPRLERLIVKLEKTVGRQAAIDREIEEEDEMILLWAA